MKRKRSRFDRLMLPTMAVGAMVAGFAAAEAKAVLIISEYVEGSSFSKAIEIYNNGTLAVDLGATSTKLQFFVNGAIIPGVTINLSGILAAGDVYVVAENDSAAAILAVADQPDTQVWFNGDDAIVLSQGATVVDSIGQVGNDPGTQWGTLLTSTADNTIRRKFAINVGDTNTTDAFDPVAEWDGFANDTFGGLGTHSGAQGADPAPPPPPPANEVLPSVGQSLTFDFQNFTGTGFTPVPASGQLDSDIFIVTGFSDGSLAYGGSGNSGDFARGTSVGGETTGGIYAFEVSPGNFALGVQPSDPDFSPGTIELRLQNLTGTVIDLLDVDFEVLVLNNEGRSSAFAFSYSTNGTTFIDVPSALVSSVAAAAQPPVWTSNPFSLTLASLGLADGSFLFLRWTGNDLGGSGSRDEFALDNIVITNPSAVIAVPEPVTFSLLIIGGVALMGRRQRAA